MHNVILYNTLYLNCSPILHPFSAEGLFGAGRGDMVIRASLRFDKRLSFSINPRKLSIF